MLFEVIVGSVHKVKDASLNKSWRLPSNFIFDCSSFPSSFLPNCESLSSAKSYSIWTSLTYPGYIPRLWTSFTEFSSLLGKLLANFCAALFSISRFWFCSGTPAYNAARSQTNETRQLSFVLAAIKIVTTIFNTIIIINNIFLRLLRP